ncbi:hypothetical protein [Actinoplanes couchii]|uniref:Uncharacterized protein n=1 Tax=Actinoplanes couchii TaxID=403638 RepID=A0ABQ3XQV6_9ACTN|nr:hypothetical protein [Actinoplanes couchii]MDR6318845.1 hypothetical protein [Actinoplanes couchii]GID60874.1 hypothetical protein Aco03nite_092780 [Actinoplanes couchii]
MSRRPNVTGRELLRTTGFFLITVFYLLEVVEKGGWRLWMGAIAVMTWLLLFVWEVRDYLSQRRSDRVAGRDDPETRR